MINKLDDTIVKERSMGLCSDALAPTKQPKYLNTVVKIETTLDPHKLLASLQQIEDALGRTRPKRYAARTIDLDILMYDNLVIDTDDLTIPHPQMHLRDFVMYGMMDIAPGVTHPLIGERMLELWQRLNGHSFMLSEDTPKLISVAGIIGIGKTTLAEALSKQLDCPVIREAYDTNPYIADVYAGRTDLALKSQLYFLNSRAEQLTPDKLEPNKPVVSDYIFDKDAIFARKTLTEDEFAIYKQQYKNVSENIVSPSLVIHLVDSSWKALERIRFRNREYEQGIEEKFLAELSEEYDKLLAYNEFKICPVITLNTSSFDSRIDEHVRRLANQVRRYIWTS